MTGLLVAVGLLAGGLLLVCRLFQTGQVRAMPVVALGVGLLLVATPPGQELRGLLGEGLLVVVRLVAWVLAPLATVGLLMVATVRLARESRPAGSRGRVASVVLTLLLGLVGALLLAQLPATPAVGRWLAAGAGRFADGLVEVAAVVLGGDADGGVG